ncbi:MAG: 4Fe-4S binding protein [Coriobacteriia bacterium]|nr:4Fe-4S binding protein [Coriobacteriia bacterium]
MAVEKAPKGPRATARIVRWTVLAAVLVLVTVLGYLHQVVGVGKPVGVDALCPFGGLETLFSLIAGTGLIKKIAASSVALLVAAVVTALVFRRAFCGRICPLGYLQELFGGIGRKLFKRRLEMPKVLDRPARYLKYVVLAAVLLLTWNAGELVIRSYDPWVAYNHLTSAELLTENGIGLAVLVIALAGSLVYDRFFCKYACPMGAFLGLISKVSIFKVRRNTETCIDCKACDKACPVNVIVSEVETVTSPECIDCGECVSACPVADTLAVSARGKKGLSPVTAGVLAVGTFAVLVAGATVTDNFDWKVASLRDQIESGQGSGEGEGTGGSIEGLPFDTALIKGSTPLSEVVEASGIPASVFTQVYGVPESEMDSALKDLKDAYGCSPGEVRAFIAAYYEDPAVVDTWEVGAFEEAEGNE